MPHQNKWVHRVQPEVCSDSLSCATLQAVNRKCIGQVGVIIIAPIYIGGDFHIALQEYQD